MTNGKVYLVGAGPGDPDLITVKGKRCLQAADVIIYDYLAAPALLALTGDNAEKIYVGKKGGDHTLSQEGINQLIVEKALAGKTVVRLKGGDPYIFGRGGEEVEALASRGIAFEVVPGITSAIAAAAYAGIPLTHRDMTSTLAFVTGHEDPTRETSRIDWAALAQGIGTLVFFMGVKNLPDIVGQLIANGKPADTPVALIRWGTTSDQKTVTGTLETIVETVAAAGLKAPAIIVVGAVVSLRSTHRWFDTRALTGKTIVVTRARAQASDLVSQLNDLGATCLECPTIRILPPENLEPLDQAVADIGAYNWLVFTSVNGVTAFFDRLSAAGKDARALGHVRTAAIGPATAEKMKAFGIGCDILPHNFRAEAVVAAFEKEAVRGQRVLLPRAREARPILPEALREMGARVDEVAAYQTVRDDHGAHRLKHLLSEKQIDMVTFTSSSTATNFRALFTDDEFRNLMPGVTVAAIGPITADTVRNLGMTVHLEAVTYTIPGLCEAILGFYKHQDAIP